MKLLGVFLTALTIGYSGLSMADTKVDIFTYGSSDEFIEVRLTYSEYTGNQQPGDDGVIRIFDFFSNENDGGISIIAEDPDGNPTQAFCSFSGGFDDDFEQLRDRVKLQVPGYRTYLFINKNTGNCHSVQHAFDSRLVQN